MYLKNKSNSVHFRLSQSLFDDLAIICANKNITLSSLINFVLADYVRRCRVENIKTD